MVNRLRVPSYHEMSGSQERFIVVVRFTRDNLELCSLMGSEEGVRCQKDVGRPFFWLVPLPKSREGKVMFV